jgi:hypothetical protein
LIRAYSQRLLTPYSGIVLIAETERARAQSFDALNWEIQYLSGNEDKAQRQYRVQGYGLDRGYYQVASLKNRELKTFIFPPHVDADEVSASIHELTDFLLRAKLPFPIADLYEYWLLDSTDDSPLVVKLPRTPGRKDSEYMHLFSGPIDVEVYEPPEKVSTPGLEARVSQLEADLAEIKAMLSKVLADD